MNAPLLGTVRPEEIRTRRSSLDGPTVEATAKIVRDVRDRGEAAVREYAERWDGLRRSEPLILSRAELATAADDLPGDQRNLLMRTADRIRRFAEAQRASWTDVRLAIPGGVAGHTIHPVKTAGCYAPGGRYPLVSTMLMTVVTARTAGVECVVAASPNPNPLMRAAAAIAGADQLLTAGGAHAIAAMAYGFGSLPACDVIVGPGNRWVTAAKFLVSADVRIDMLAGPSELLVLADHSADPEVVAADLLAQAEHDIDACPMLLSMSADLLDEVNHCLRSQLTTLPSRETAIAAMGNGFAILAQNVDEACSLANRIAPEHLELHVQDPDAYVSRIRTCGCLFIGADSAEVLGDYGAGPNHTLPTGGTARFNSGLSVFRFLREQMFLKIDTPRSSDGLCVDAIALSRLEGLEAHARSAERRLA
jgi:phosphoribosyl-ATP pyrophosphohydrolase/phosphoribosyl-AMP cyclohydrolase/histidinol dehydrogenase